MESSSVNYGTIDMYDALPPHPAASWEPGNVGSFPLRITALLDETGGILVHIDTAVTLNLAKEKPPLTGVFRKLVIVDFGTDIRLVRSGPVSVPAS
ncbi:hypothetical protein, partial [Frankia sp. KB5]|uniref:hypothetical protein n=1 Tax=Frankia sp. KB5 TaxID=683318 RepID=UPI000A261296